jgi:hypothetical protein
MAALWETATVEERRDMITQVLEPGGLHYDVEVKEIAAITPRPAFLPVLRLLEGWLNTKKPPGRLSHHGGNSGTDGLRPRSHQC